MRACLFAIVLAIGCQASFDDTSSSITIGGSGSGVVDAPTPLPDATDWIQPNAVDDRMPDHDGYDDGQSCQGEDAGIICVMISDCPNYCVSCSDGASSGCYPCP